MYNLISFLLMIGALCYGSNHNTDMFIILGFMSVGFAIAGSISDISMNLYHLLHNKVQIRKTKEKDSLELEVLKDSEDKNLE